MSTPGRIRNGSIDLMKFLFTLVVMLYHTTKLFPGGYIAVDFFFIVSGYLMSKSTEKRIANGIALGSDTLSFVLHKAKGIFPFYLSAFILSFCFTCVLGGSGIKQSLLTLFHSPYNIFMLGMAGNYDMGHRVQASWYISAMLLGILLMYPIRKKNVNVFDHIIAPILFLVFVGWAHQTGGGVSYFTVGYQSNIFMYNGMFRGIAEMAIGCSCYTLGKKLQNIHFTFWGKLIVSLFELIGYALIFFCASRYSQSDTDLTLLLLIAMSVTLSFSGKGLLSPILNNRLCSFLGSFSLQMYLTHELVKNVILPYARKHTDLGLFMDRTLCSYLFVYICSTVIAAIICRILGTLLKKFHVQICRLWKAYFIESKS